MPEKPTRRGGALETGLDILETLAMFRSLGVTEISRHVGADKANVHRLLQVLRARGYVEQDGASKEYRATAQLLAMAGAVVRGLDLISVVRPLMLGLLEQSGESVHVAVPTARGAVYVAQERPKGRISVETEIGSEPPIHSTATGKSLYAFLGPERLHAVVRVPLQRYTVRTIESMTALEADLIRVRERGYALDDEEYSPGVRCVAAPIFGLHGDVVAALGVSGPATRMTLEHVEASAEMVRQAAAAATRELGGQVPGMEPAIRSRNLRAAGD
jgi:DNA-binding IclR family transcriptional regulator